MMMNAKNYEYLNDQLFYTGFGRVLGAQLKEKMESGEPEFQLYFKTGNNYENLTAELRFSQSKTTDYFFFNSFRLELMRKNFESINSQVFYINQNYHFTLKEAYNLLQGRAVTKRLESREGDQYEVWMKLDLQTLDMNGNHKIKQFHENYGFNIDEELEKLPIVELIHEPEKTYLLDSLRKGNRQSATLNLETGESRVFLEANPQYKAIDMYNDKLMRIQFVQDQSKGGVVERLWPAEDEEVSKAEEKDQESEQSDNSDAEPKPQKKSGRKSQSD
ncbi:MAG: hypothetical protein ACTHXT_14930 [Sphingobacterium sp.]